MQHWQVFEDCRAAVRFGGAWFNSEAKLVDCHFLRCHAGTGPCGGLSSANGASVEMIRGSIMGCSGTSAAGVYIYGLSTLRLVDVTIAECRATADDGNGGGIFMEASGGGLTMSPRGWDFFSPSCLQVAGRRACVWGAGVAPSGGRTYVR